MIWKTRLGLPQFAHLRAVAEGVDPLDSAQRYLGPDTRHAAWALHHALVDRARALARQSGKGAWRLIGVSLGAAAVAADPANEGTEHVVVPTLEEWMAAQGYDGFRQSDLIDLYHAQFPPDRKRARNARLREQVLALLRELEKLHVVAASPDAAAQVRAGKTQTFGFLVGQVMKASGGKANPKLVNQLLRRVLES